MASADFPFEVSNFLIFILQQQYPVSGVDFVAVQYTCQTKGKGHLVLQAPFHFFIDNIRRNNGA